MGLRRIGKALVCAALALSWAQAALAQQMPPPAVVVAPVVAQEVSQRAEFMGRVEPIEVVDLRARVQGFLEEVHFREGERVSAGDLLYVIEAAPYQAALEAARAELTRAEAAQAEAQRTYARTAELRQRGTVAQAALDEATAARDQTAAGVAVARANVVAAELELSYTRVQSPIDGRIGRSNLTLGNLVGPDSGVLARVVMLDPIRVAVSLPERDYLEVRQDRAGSTIEEIEAAFVPSLRLPTGAIYPGEGRIDFLDNEVDPRTGTIRLWARFENPALLLLPGQYVTLSVRSESGETLPVIPQGAVLQDREGTYVFIVDGENVAQQRRVTLGQRLEQNVAVAQGLNPGERIVVEGVQRVRPGGAVQPVENDPPADTPADVPAAADPPQG